MPMATNNPIFFLAWLGNMVITIFVTKCLFVYVVLRDLLPVRSLFPIVLLPAYILGY